MVTVASSSRCGCLLRGAVGALNFILAPPMVVGTRLHSCVAMLPQSLPHGRPPCLPNSGGVTGLGVRFNSHLVAESMVARRRSRRSSMLSTSIAPPGHAATEGVSKVPTLMSGMSERSLAEARRKARFDEGGEYRVFRELLEGTKTRFVSRVMYDGTNYKGFQLQTNGLPTVQVRPETCRLQGLPHRLRGLSLGHRLYRVLWRSPVRAKDQPV